MLVGWKTARMPRFPLERLEERLAVVAQDPTRRGRRRRWPSAAQHEALSLPGVLSLVLAGPEALGGIEAPPYRDDVPLLSYGSGDRTLARRYEGPTLAKLTFNALPLSPYAKLARYFGGPLPQTELEDERAKVLGNFRIASPVQIALAEERLRTRAPGEPKARRSRSGAARAERRQGRLAGMDARDAARGAAARLDAGRPDRAQPGAAPHRDRERAAA
jgi:hypothetical protein